MLDTEGERVGLSKARAMINEVIRRGRMAGSEWGFTMFGEERNEVRGVVRDERG